MPFQDAGPNLIGLAPIVIAVAALLVALIFGVLIPRVRRSHLRRGPIPIIAFGPAQEALPPRPHLRTLPDVTAVAPGTHAPPAAAPAATQVATAAPNVDVARTGTDGLVRPEGRPGPEGPLLRLETSAPEAAPRPPWRPPPRPPRAADGTLQFLPGRFEILEGRDLGQEIRFVRPPGASEVEITLGRGDGPQYRHIQLHEPTVSRLHARMSLDGRRWMLTNLSRTNPVVVNGAAMEDEGSTHTLSDGDRVELGEVVLRFRQR